MKKQVLWLLLFGNLCMSFSLFTRHFIKVPESIDELLKGLGVALIISALVVQKKLKRAC
jgi:uncharacterized protein YhhL (DUF1145 family)